jgi:hypothetical protein
MQKDLWSRSKVSLSQSLSLNKPLSQTTGNRQGGTAFLGPSSAIIKGRQTDDHENAQDHHFVRGLGVSVPRVGCLNASNSLLGMQRRHRKRRAHTRTPTTHPSPPRPTLRLACRSCKPRPNTHERPRAFRRRGPASAPQSPQTASRARNRIVLFPAVRF